MLPMLHRRAFQAFLVLWAVGCALSASGASLGEPSHLYPKPYLTIQDRLQGILGRLEARRTAREESAAKMGLSLPSKSRIFFQGGQGPSSDEPILDLPAKGREPPPEPRLTSPEAPSRPRATPQPPAFLGAPSKPATVAKGTPAHPMPSHPGSVIGRARQPTLQASPATRPLALTSGPNGISSDLLQPPPFARTLQRMLMTREARIREAARLGIVLPSQGGEFPESGRTLSKIGNLLTELAQRAPDAAPVNFGFYPG